MLERSVVSVCGSSDRSNCGIHCSHNGILSFHGGRLPHDRLTLLGVERLLVVFSWPVRASWEANDTGWRMCPAMGLFKGELFEEESEADAGVRDRYGEVGVEGGQ
ncbi:MAG: hypothetical protein SGPRY_001218, partial [Prymnesium sp.]